MGNCPWDATAEIVVTYVTKFCDFPIPAKCRVTPCKTADWKKEQTVNLDYRHETDIQYVLAKKGTGLVWPNGRTIFIARQRVRTAVPVTDTPLYLAPRVVFRRVEMRSVTLLLVDDALDER